MPKREQFIRKQTTLLFHGKASDFGAFSKSLARHTDLVNHQVMIVSSGVLAAGEYAVRFIPADPDTTLESTVKTDETLVMAAKDSAIATFVGMIDGIHLEVLTPLSAGETISAVITSYTKVYPSDTAYISTLIADSRASDSGEFAAMPVQHRGGLYHQVSLVSSGTLAAGVYNVKLIPDVDETLETSVDIGKTLDIAGADSDYVQFIGVCKGIHLEVSTPLTGGETISAVWSTASEQFDTMILAAIGGTTDHTMLTNIGTNSHVAIDSHIADGTLHFTEASIDHTNIQNIGTNSHAAIDSHMAIAVEADAAFGTDNAVIISDGVARKAKVSLITIDASGNVDNVETISFNKDNANPTWEEGLSFYDKDEHALVVYNDIAAVSQQLGRELYIRIYNNTGVEIADGKPVSVVGIGVDKVLQIGLTDASIKQSALTYLGLTTHTVAIGGYGYVAAFGFVNDVDTTVLTAGLPIWCDPDNPGLFVQTEPDSPAWNVRCGGCSVSDVNGQLFSRPAIGSNTQSSTQFLNGSILEPLVVQVASDGVAVTCSVVNGNSPTITELSAMFSGEFRVLDYSSSTLYEVPITPGTDIAPQRNYVYFLDSTNVLTVSTSGFPTSEQFVPIADIICQSAASAQTDEVYKFHVWTDHIKGTDDRGHLAHINQWIRNRPAGWVSGVVLTASEAEGVSAAVIDLSYTSGEVYQLHPHAFPAINTASVNKYAYIENHPVTPYTPMDGLNATDLAEDANGDSLNNKVYSLVIWGVICEHTAHCKLYANLPNGFYTTEASGISDVDNTADYSIPVEFTGTGFLITRLVMKNSGGNVQIVGGGEFDLRGTFPAATGGGVSGGAGVTLYTQLLDTDNVYTGLAGLAPVVNVGETGLEIGFLDHDVGLSNSGVNSHSVIDSHLALVPNHLDWTSGSQAGFDSLGIDDNCTTYTNLRLAESELLIGSGVIHERPHIGLYNPAGGAYMTIGGDETNLLGASILLMSDTYVGFEGDMIFYSMGARALDFKNSTSLWDFKTNSVLIQDLEITGAFLSQGIDDNATTVVVTVEGGQLLLGTGALNTTYHVGLKTPSGQTFMSFGSDDTYLTGSSMLFFGATHAFAYDMKFYAAGVFELFYDHSASSWDFQANDITTTGDLSVGGFTSTPINAFSATVEQLNITDSRSIFGGSVYWANDDLTQPETFGALALDAVTPSISFDSGDRLTYDRTFNKFSVVIGSLTAFDCNATSINYGQVGITTHTISSNSADANVVFSFGSNTTNGTSIAGYGGSHADTGNFEIRSGSTDTLTFDGTTWDAQSHDFQTLGNGSFGMSPFSTIYAGVPSVNANAIAAVHSYNAVTANTAAQIHFVRSRHATKGGHTIVQDGDSLGWIVATGSDGVEYAGDTCGIAMSVDGTPALGSVPGQMSFFTTAVGDTYSTERMRIDASGNVGIGQTNPTAVLHVAALTADSNAFNVGNSTMTDGYVQVREQTGQTENLFVLNTRASAAAGKRGIVFAQDNVVRASIDSPAVDVLAFYNDSTFDETMRIDASGNVGIGNTSPLRPLHIGSGAGTIATASTYKLLVEHSSDCVAQIRTPDTGRGQLYFGSPSHFAGGQINFYHSAHATVQKRLETVSSGDMTWLTNGSERMCITAAGDVGIGTDAPLEKLDVAGVIRADGSGLFSNFIGRYASANSSTGGFTIERSRGTVALPTALLSGDYMMSISSEGYGATGWVSGGKANITTRTTENWSDTAAGTEMTFSTTENTTLVNTDRVKISHDGNVGIGVTTPTYKLQIDGSIGFSGTGSKELKCLDAATNFSMLGGSANTGNTAVYGGNASNTGAGVLCSGTSHASWGDAIRFVNDAFTLRMVIITGGNVGIGVAAPTHKLEVDGLVKAKGFIADFAELQISTATDHGGVNNTVVAAVWDGTELHKDTRSFTHSTVTNPSRITIVETGRYHLKGVIACTSAAANRQTLATRYRIDGGTWVTLGAQKDYNRGSAYGAIMRVPFDIEVDITAASYIEVGTNVEDTDLSATALATTDSVFIIRRIG